MRKIKNVFTLLMSVVLMVLNSGNACFASSSDNHYEACSTVTPHTTYGTAIKCDYDLPLNTDSSTQYFLFTPSEQRMNPDGSFIFSYSWAMPGDQCNRQVLFHKFRQIIFHNPRHLRFHSPRHFIFHTCHYAVSSKNDFLFSSL